MAMPPIRFPPPHRRRFHTFTTIPLRGGQWKTEGGWGAGRQRKERIR